MADGAGDPGSTATIARRRGGTPDTAVAGNKPVLSNQGVVKLPADSRRVLRNGNNLLAIPLMRLKLGWYNHMPGDVARFRGTDIVNAGLLKIHRRYK
jgi:hypothetical protein